MMRRTVLVNFLMREELVDDSAELLCSETSSNMILKCLR